MVSLIQATVNCGDLVADSLRVSLQHRRRTELDSNVLMTRRDSRTSTTATFRRSRAERWSATTCGPARPGWIGTDPARAPAEGHSTSSWSGPVPRSDRHLRDRPGWTVGAPGDAATDGIWERVDPVGQDRSLQLAGRTARGRPHGRAGRDLLGHRRPRRLLPANYDVDGGATTILPRSSTSTPRCRGAGKLDFWAFFANEAVIDDTLRAFGLQRRRAAPGLDLVKIYGVRRH